MIVGGCFGLLYADRLSKKYESTTARIEDIQIKYKYAQNSKRKTKFYRVWISYQVDGIPYKTSLGYYQSSWETGNSTKIDYDPQDPAKVTTIGGNRLICKLLIGIGLVTLVLLYGFTKLINKMYKGNFWKQASY